MKKKYLYIFAVIFICDWLFIGSLMYKDFKKKVALSQIETVHKMTLMYQKSSLKHTGQFAGKDELFENIFSQVDEEQNLSFILDINAVEAKKFGVDFSKYIYFKKDSFQYLVFHKRERKLFLVNREGVFKFIDEKFLN